MIHNRYLRNNMFLSARARARLSANANFPSVSLSLSRGGPREFAALTQTASDLASSLGGNSHVREEVLEVILFLDGKEKEKKGGGKKKETRSVSEN